MNASISRPNKCGGIIDIKAKPHHQKDIDHMDRVVAKLKEWDYEEVSGDGHDNVVMGAPYGHTVTEMKKDYAAAKKATREGNEGASTQSTSGPLTEAAHDRERVMVGEIKIRSRGKVQICRDETEALDVLKGKFSGEHVSLECSMGSGIRRSLFVSVSEVGAIHETYGEQRVIDAEAIRTIVSQQGM